MILRVRIYRLLLKIGIYLLPIIAFPLGRWMWVAACDLLGRNALFAPSEHLIDMFLATLVWAFISEHYRVTNFDELFYERTGAKAAGTACMVTFFVLLAILYFSRNEVFPRGLLVFDTLSLLVLCVLVHAVFRVFCRTRSYLARPTRLLVIGADEFAVKSAARLKRLSFAPCEITGHVQLAGQHVHVTGCPVYNLEEMGTIPISNPTDEVVIAIPPAEFSRLPFIVRSLEHLCLPTRAVVDLGEGLAVRQKLFQLGNIQMLDLTSTPTESLDYALLKRGFDVLFSLLVLILTAPLFLLIALTIRLTSHGPVFFVQERVGLNGKTFKMYKFRTMHVNHKANSDIQWTTVDDPRRTALGALLRKTSLDELPQFINVLKGNMSVVGPRPERPHFVGKFLQEVARYNHRHTLKVGITGWAQVNGWRGNTSIEKRVEYDLYYLQNWSFGFDLRIILMTLLVGFINRHAY